MDTKYCRYCQQDRPLADFYQKAGSRDGLEYKCKACIKDYMAKRYAESDAHQQALVNQAWRAENAEAIEQQRREKDAQHSRAYYAANREKVRAAQKGYSEKHRDRLQAYSKEYRIRNREHLCAQLRARQATRSEEERAKQRAYYKKKYRELKTAILLRLGGACYCCGLTELPFLTIDHINNDGTEDRKPDGKSRNSYTMLRLIWKSENFFERYRAACFNCNCARHYTEDKVCPHQR